MLLAVDVGNTSINFGLFHPRKTSKPPKPVLTFRLSTFPMRSPKMTAGLIRRNLGKWKGRLSACAIASVVPRVDPVLNRIFRWHFSLKPFWVLPRTKIPIRNLYKDPRQVGADRIVNAAACFARFGGPAVIVDFGTATTFDCLTRRGEYAGGLIVPGPDMASESLHLKTAKLPFVKIARPGHLIGKTTAESIQAGLFYGYISLVDGILDRLTRKLGPRCRTIATGGLASLIAGASRHLKRTSVYPDLTLEGIFQVWKIGTDPYYFARIHRRRSRPK